MQKATFDAINESTSCEFVLTLKLDIAKNQKDEK